MQFEPEEDGRWIAEVLGISGALVYGRTREEALVVARRQGLGKLSAVPSNGGA